MSARGRFEHVERVAPWAPLIAATTLLAVIATRAILAKTGGEPAVPLDDSYIHFQFARSFARLQPMVYSPGAAATPGATSLLWPVVLSPFWALGLKGTTLIWAAWGIGWLCLGLLARETQLLAQRLVSRESSIAAGAMVLAFGGLVWCAGSGMEVVPFAWLLVRAMRLCADFKDGAPHAASGRARAALIATAALAAAARPEGAIAVLAAATTLVAWPRGATRLWGLAALATIALPPLVNLACTGQLASTTAVAKWLPGSPYFRDERLTRAVADNLGLVFDTLLDGRIWSAIFIPAGSRFVAWLALPALLFVAWRRRALWRGTLVLAVALALLLPATYECMLCNRLRYLWPFAPGWFVALAALADAVGMVAQRFGREPAFVRVLTGGAFVGALASQLSPSIDDLANSSDAIRRQQTELGRWAKESLPPEAVVGVNDTGAIAYFSDRRVFDIVGLTTKGEARYWVAGAGARFEHYEKLPRAELPTHFIVYPQWMALPQLLGKELTERTVDATILGGRTMVAHEADYSLLGSGESALLEVPGKLLDSVDVGDLESEAAHDYQLFWATQAECVVFEDLVAGGLRADGGRRGRSLERFVLDVATHGHFVARLSSDEALQLEVRVDRKAVGSFDLTAAAGWQERSLVLPAELGAGRREVELVAPAGKTFSALHYWSSTGDGAPPAPAPEP